MLPRGPWWPRDDPRATLDQIRTRLIRGTSWLLFGSFAAALLTGVQSILLARMLGPTGFGTLALVMAYGAFVSQLFDGRSWETAIKYVSRFIAAGECDKAAATVRALLLVDVVTAVVASAAIIATAELAARLLLKDPGSAGLLRLYALTVVAAAPMGIATALLRMANRYAGLALREAVIAAVQLIGIVALVLSGFGLDYIISFLVLSTLLKSAWSLQLAKAGAREIGLGSFSSSRLTLLRGERREISRFWLSTSAIALLKGIIQQADVLAVGFWAGPAQTSFFRLARNLTQIVAFPLAPFYQAAYPELAKLWHQKGRSGVRHLALALVALGAAAGAALAAAVWLVADSLVAFTAGPEFAPAAPLLKLLLIGVCCNVALQYVHSLILAAGLVGRALAALVTPVVVQLALLWLLVPQYGATGAAAAFIGYSITRSIHLLGAAWPILAPHEPSVKQAATGAPFPSRQ